MSEPKPKFLNIPVKGVYCVSFTELDEPVERRHSEFVWLHQQLRREFPGLRLPDPPENNLKAVTQFMDKVMQNDLLAGCFLTSKFCSARDEAQEKETLRLREQLYPEPDGVEKLKAFLSEGVVVTPKEADMLFAKAQKTPDVIRSMTADYDRFAESVLETFGAVSVHLGHIKRALSDIEAAMESVAERFREAASHTNAIISILKRLNFAKTQFPQFDASQVNLDIVFLKLKNGFDSAGGVRREGGRPPQPGGSGTALRPAH